MPTTLIKSIMKIYNNQKGLLNPFRTSLCANFYNKYNLKISFVSLVISVICFSLNAQNKPFPQQNDWANCIKPNVPQSELNADVAAFYDLWKGLYLRETNMPDGYYVHGECTGCTEPAKGTSEGHGWGMLITVLMAGHDANAKTYFDGFYKYFDQHRSPFNDELMSWMVEYSENGGEATATDGDLDIAYALLLAHDQWGSNGEINYLQEAKDMITLGIKVSDMNVSTQRVMLGTWDTNGNSTRSSDWMIAQFRAYKAATNDSFWDGAIDTAYGIMNTIQSNYSANTGLMPDFVVNSNPAPANPFFLESENDGNYFWNACRFPWRVAMDYAHYGNQNAKTVVNKIVNWAKTETGGNPANYSAGYTLDGTPLATYSSTAFTSPLLVASIVDAQHQSFLDSGWQLIKSSNYSYYDASINLLSMLVISGNWWVPQQEVTTPNDILTVSSLSDFEDNGGSQSITINSNINWSVSENSNWITVNSTSGSGNGSVTVNVSENTSSTSRSANITISGNDISRNITVFQEGAELIGGNQTAYVSHSIPGIIQAEDYDNGGQGVAYNDTTTINSGEQGRINEGVDVQNTSAQEGGVNVGWTADGEWLEYTIGSVTSGTYDIDLRVASYSTNTKSISLSLDGTQLGSSSIAYTGGWQVWQTLTLSNVQITGGQNKVLRISISGGSYNINYVSFSSGGTENYLNVSSLSDFEASASSQTISVVSNVDWTVSENSSWVSINNTSGANSGSVQVSVSENSSTSSRSATVSISGGGITRSVAVFQEGADDSNTGCGNIPTWNALTIYSEKGTQVVYGNNIYENKWYTLNQSPADYSAHPWSLWTLLGSCDSAAKSLGEISDNSLGIISSPNPFTNQINVSSNDDVQTIASLQLVDLSGRIIATEAGTNMSTLNGVANGMYLLQILNSNGQVISVQKVIKK